MVTTISQAKDLSTLELEEHIGTLRAHGVILQGDKPTRKGKVSVVKASQNSQESSSSQRR